MQLTVRLSHSGKCKTQGKYEKGKREREGERGKDREREGKVGRERER